MEIAMSTNVSSSFRLWDDVPDVERYSSAWMSRHSATMRDRQPDQRLWQDADRCAQWVREADEDVQRRLRKPGRCAAAVLRTSRESIWAPCGNRHTEGDTLCANHRRMAPG